MTEKRYTLKTTCPQCGCSAVSHLNREEMIKRFGHVPNVELECSECMARFSTPMKTACPEWDTECRLSST